ncbi:MAG: TVP38/TMEM64 family protein [Planctomycetes bacterium]|nr:TVP38/TMEM64 family protein [Planctomycetota bacterium]
MRLLWIALALAALVLVPFLVWGERFEAAFTVEGSVAWLRDAGPWGAVLLFALLVSDLFLPVPATPLMSAGGYVYGALGGGAIAAAGSIASGLLAWSLCRRLGRGMAERLVGARDLDRSHALFERAGPWLVACSRWMPILPEVTASLAGLTRMSARRFVPALVAGSVPMGFAYAAIGASGHDRPWLAIAASLVLPAVLLIAARGFAARARRNGEDERT